MLRCRVNEALDTACLLPLFCALWDRNGPHNQLEIRITAALWVPLLSHPLKQVSGLCESIPGPGPGPALYNTTKDNN